MVLHRNERRQVVRDRIALHDVELPSVATRHSNVTRVSCFDDIMESLHSLSDGSIRIEPMALEDIDIVKLESL